MKVIIVKEGKGLHTVIGQATRQGEMRVPPIHGVLQRDIGEAVAALEHDVRPQEVKDRLGIT